MITPASFIRFDGSIRAKELKHLLERVVSMLEAPRRFEPAWERQREWLLKDLLPILAMLSTEEGPFTQSKPKRRASG